MTNVSLTDLHMQTEAQVAMPDGATVKDAVASGVEQLGFPSHYATGEPITYRARDTKSGALLGPDQLVSDLSDDDPTIQLISEVPAAGFPVR